MTRRKTMIFLAAALFCIAGIIAVRGSLETMLIFPGAATQGRPDTVIPPGGDYEIVPLRTGDGTGIVAQFGKALGPDGRPVADPRRSPTVIFFYGNGACASYMEGEFRHFRELGANVILPEYPGYGMSGGRPSEKGFYGAADAAYDYLLQRQDIDPGRIVASGWSMGAAVAMDLASRRKVVALQLVSAFTTLHAAAHFHVPWLPVSLILKSRFDNLSKIPGITCPIFIAHGTDDNIVPQAMADQLAGAARSKVTVYKISGAGHNDVFRTGGSDLWAALRASIFAAK